MAKKPTTALIKRPIAPGVLDELAAIVPQKPTWLDKASPEARAKMVAIRELLRNNEMPHTKRTIHLLAKQNGIKVGHDTLSRWLDEKA